MFEEILYSQESLEILIKKKKLIKNKSRNRKRLKSIKSKIEIAK